MCAASKMTCRLLFKLWDRGVGRLCSSPKRSLGGWTIGIAGGKTRNSSRSSTMRVFSTKFDCFAVLRGDALT